MVLRDKIIQIQYDKEFDTMGGFEITNETSKDYDCKVSFNTSPEVASSYGLVNEQIIYVITREELDKQALYVYKDKQYSIRFQTNNNRLFFSTLIELKGGRD